MKVITWNLEWACSGSKRAKLMADRIKEVCPDVVCYTEVIEAFLPDGFAILADDDYGYSNTAGKRKVALWSRMKWEDVDAVGDDALPSGRFISGVTEGLRFIGVCIPWRDAHVKTGRRDRTCWEDHLRYCEGLERVIEKYSDRDEPICLLGDFNQRIPRVNQPVEVYDALLASFSHDFTVATKGILDVDGKPLIDHVVTCSKLNAQVEQILPKVASDGTALSDHVGVVVNLSIS